MLKHVPSRPDVALHFQSSASSLLSPWSGHHYHHQGDHDHDHDIIIVAVVVVVVVVIIIITITSVNPCGWDDTINFYVLYSERIRHLPLSETNKLNGVVTSICLHEGATNPPPFSQICLARNNISIFS